MLKIAFFIGIYSYTVLLLGILNMLYPIVIILVSIVFLFSAAFFYRDRFLNTRVFEAFKNLTRIEKCLLFLIAMLSLVNLVGALGPELAFDALWYHLTIPKLFLQSHKVYFIQGNLFYYSLMPKLAEMLYVTALSFGSEVYAKLFQFAFGLGAVFVTYRIGRLYVSKKFSLLAATIFYSNLVVCWLSISAYVDLTRVFFESLALFYFLLYTNNKSRKVLIYSGVVLGFAICTKLVSLISIPIFVMLLFVEHKNFKKWFEDSFLFAAISLIIPFPWFVVSYIYTKNSFYPLFSSLAPHSITFSNFYPWKIVQNLIQVFLFSNDPINPIYVVIAPILFFIGKKEGINKYLILYCLFSIVFWYISTFLGLWYATDQAGSARFLTAYFPAFSVLTAFALSFYKKNLIGKLGIGTVVIIAITAIFYRSAANYKYVPVLLGIESKQDFLMKNLNFSYGDFYDENGEIRKLVGNNKVLLQGLHNLYYVDFPYILPEWEIANNAKFMLVQHAALPTKYLNAKLYYENRKTHVKLYKL